MTIYFIVGMMLFLVFDFWIGAAKHAATVPHGMRASKALNVFATVLCIIVFVALWPGIIMLVAIKTIALAIER